MRLSPTSAVVSVSTAGVSPPYNDESAGDREVLDDFAVSDPDKATSEDER